MNSEYLKIMLLYAIAMCARDRAANRQIIGWPRAWMFFCFVLSTRIECCCSFFFSLFPHGNKTTKNWIKHCYWNDTNGRISISFKLQSVCIIYCFCSVHIFSAVQDSIDRIFSRKIEKNEYYYCCLVFENRKYTWINGRPHLRMEVSCLRALWFCVCTQFILWYGRQ